MIKRLLSMNLIASFLKGAGITTSVLRTIEKLPLIKHLEKLIVQIRKGLLAFVIMFAVLVGSVLFIAVYFLVQLVQGR